MNASVEFVKSDLERFIGTIKRMVESPARQKYEASIKFKEQPHRLGDVQSFQSALHILCQAQQTAGVMIQADDFNVRKALDLMDTTQPLIDEVRSVLSGFARSLLPETPLEQVYPDTRFCLEYVQDGIKYLQKYAALIGRKQRRGLAVPVWAEDLKDGLAWVQEYYADKATFRSWVMIADRLWASVKEAREHLDGVLSKAQ
jgi:hypothetical protein